MNLSRIFLVLSGVVISLIGLLYGVSPQWFANRFMTGAPPLTVDQAHVFRAIMTLYLGLGGFWIYCSGSEKYQGIGLAVAAIFCGSLVAGRLLSVVVDGVPAPVFVTYIVAELAAVPLYLWLHKRHVRDTSRKES